VTRRIRLRRPGLPGERGRQLLVEPLGTKRARFALRREQSNARLLGRVLAALLRHRKGEAYKGPHAEVALSYGLEQQARRMRDKGLLSKRDVTVVALAAMGRREALRKAKEGRSQAGETPLWLLALLVLWVTLPILYHLGSCGHP
jgi:hypothetical protein